MHRFDLPPGKRLYFASDLHLGAPNSQASRERERAFCAWLDAIAPSAEAVYIVGDLFDFWFEYRHAVPKGFVRTLGKLAGLHDQGVKLYFFTGNHDLWAKDYLTEEIGFEVFTKPIRHVWGGKSLVIGHGDGLGPGDTGYKVLKRIFTFKPFQWAFGWIHPDLGIGLASWLSRGSRARTGQADYGMKTLKEEALFQFAQAEHLMNPADYWIFGHRHFPAIGPLESSDGQQGTYLNLGDWIKWQSWAEFDGTHLHLRIPPQSKN
ncbi:MAG: UDP-2,3-diacylglucosamine diphosphatase [Cryomorphaceae bacterium]|nr:UDP-2,3-diacylglucosamine diphosphatase [Cryomorphaceae bacterium]